MAAVLSALELYAAPAVIIGPHLARIRNTAKSDLDEVTEFPMSLAAVMHKTWPQLVGRRRRRPTLHTKPIRSDGQPHPLSNIPRLARDSCPLDMPRFRLAVRGRPLRIETTHVHLDRH